MVGRCLWAPALSLDADHIGDVTVVPAVSEVDCVAELLIAISTRADTREDKDTTRVSCLWINIRDVVM